MNFLKNLFFRLRYGYPRRKPNYTYYWPDRVFYAHFWWDEGIVRIETGRTHIGKYLIGNIVERFFVDEDSNLRVNHSPESTPMMFADEVKRAYVAWAVEKELLR